MASGRTIDSLVVLLGLNAKGFSAGMKGATNELTSFTRNIAGMFFAVRGLDDVIGQFKDLHRQLADLAFVSRSLGVSASGLSRMGEVSQLFGGQMGDAAAATRSLQDAIYGLKYTGSFAPQLMMLQRFGLPYMNTRGQPLPEKRMLEEVAAWSDRMAAQGMPVSERQYLARQMLPAAGGLATAAGSGLAAFEKAWAKAAKDQSNITNPLIESQRQLARTLTENSWILRNREAPLLAAMTPAIATLSKDMTDLAGNLMQSILPILKVIADDLNVVFGKHGSGRLALQGITDSIPPAELAKMPAWKQLLLEPVKVLSGWLKSPVSWTHPLGRLDFGLLPAAPTTADAGAPSLFQDIMSWIGSPSAMIGGAAAGGAFVPPALLSPPPTPTAPRPGGATGGWGPDAGGASGSWNPLALVGAGGTNVEIREINIATRATDANGIASSLDGALKRKLLTSSITSGQN